jgi:exodeoxyribonuclease VII small subunit
MTTPDKPFEFDKALKELEEITRWFEQADTDLDAGLAKFERGMELANELKTHLAEVENRIEKIKRRFSGSGAATPGESAAAPLVDPESTPPLSEPEPDQTGLF